MNDDYDDFEDVLEDGEVVTRPRQAFSDIDYEDALDGEVLPSQRPTFQESSEAIIGKAMYSRVYFAEVVLGVMLEDWQYEVLSALDNGETRISIRSGNGAGKTCLLAIVILHFILFRNDVKVPVTAPSSGQLKDGLIPETRKWMRKLPSFLVDLLETTQDRIYRRDSPEQNFVSFRTARRETPEALQGIHAENVLCVVDEASAVPDEVYEAAQGTMSTEGAIFVMISNPTRLQGYFYRSHHRMKAAWRTFHVTSFDTTRVDQSFVDQIANDYGVNSDQYRVKILGEFPTKDEETLIANHLVRAALDRDMQTPTTPGIWGVDVGRGGDLSALAKRNRNVLHGFKTQNYSDTMETVGWVKAEWDSTLAHERPTAIYVDSIGIGAGVADRLRELGLPAVDVNVGESPSIKARHPRMRDELWWAVKAAMETMNYAIKTNFDKKMADQIEQELCSPFAVFTDNGKDGVESKKMMRKRGLRSPNVADAICLTFAYDSAVGMGLSSSSQTSWGKALDYQTAAHVW